MFLLCNVRTVKSVFTASSPALSALAAVPLEGKTCFTEYIAYDDGLVVSVGLLFYPTVLKQIPQLVLCLPTPLS